MAREDEGESVKRFMTPTWPTTTMASAAASKLCDSCKSATATLFCRADTAFLCIPCDSKIHAANKLASRHARVWMCEVCEQAPAHVTCKADAAALCVTCDRDIHSANPLARRHHRFPVVPFFDSAAASGNLASVNLNDVVDDVGEDDEEAEAASWLIPNPNVGKVGYDMYSDMDPYLDLEYGSMDAKFQLKQELNQQNNSSSAAAMADCDGVVPVAQSKNIHSSFVNGGSSDSCFDTDFLGSKAFSFYNNNTNTNGQSLSQTVSSSSLDVGVVPDGSTMIDVSNPFGRQYNNISDSSTQAAQVLGVDREARVLRYREKRKNRKFEKTIRYASRKAYAETRPRIKGRFAKRTEMEVEVDQIYGVSPALIAADTGYGIVPTF